MKKLSMFALLIALLGLPIYAMAAAPLLKGEDVTVEGTIQGLLRSHGPVTGYPVVADQPLTFEIAQRLKDLWIGDDGRRQSERQPCAR